MTKILSARDLLDLVREREEEEKRETEVTDGGRAQGRRIYGARREARTRADAVRKTRNNTQILEAQKPPPDAGLDPPTPTLGQAFPADGRSAAAERRPVRRATVRMTQPAASERADARTLELRLPTRPAAVAPSQPVPPAPPVAPPVAERPQPRKASSQSWERVQEPEKKPASEPPAAPAESARAEAPQPAQSTASMFSWVTQKPAWSPRAAPLGAPSIPPAPIAPQAPVPPQAPTPPPPPPAPPSEMFQPQALVAEPQSVIANEPIALSTEETLVLVHYDSSESLEAVAELTGMSEWRITRIVEHLKERGVLGDLDDEVQPDPDAEPLPVAVADALRDYVDDLPPRDDQKTIAELQLMPDADEQDGESEEDPEHTVVDPDPATLGLKSKKAEAHGVPSLLGTSLSADSAEGEMLEDDDESDEENAEVDESDEENAEVDPVKKQLSEEAAAKSYLAVFENDLAKLPSDERAKLATTDSGINLYALCFDKDPQVTRALWQNINIMVDHARFAAFHHRTTLGLELIGQRPEFLKDSQVQRRLLRNPSVSEPLLRKMLLPKRLLDIYKTTMDREAAERTRQCARGLLRNKFSVTEPNDRMDLIWRTEGRCLIALSGLSIDSKTAALICARPLASLMLVQSFSRFGATPPSIISHFLKQNLVRRQLHLRNALLKHPNCPSDAKRAF